MDSKILDEKIEDLAALERVGRILSNSQFYGHAAPKIASTLDILAYLSAAVKSSIESPATEETIDENN